MQETLKYLSAMFPQYQFRSTESLGDFSGRDVAIDVFGVPLRSQKDFLRTVRPVQDNLKDMLGSRPLFIFRNVGMRPAT